MKSPLLFLSLILIAPRCAWSATANGYDALVEASNLLASPQPGVAPVAGHKITPEENLLRQRGEEERNAPALKQLRAALQQTIVMPSVALDEKFMAQLGKFERLGFQLNTESNVRAADGDFAGALDSRLTILDLEISLMRGGGIAMTLNNQFMEERARRDFLKLAAKVDAATLKQDVERLKAMDDGRVPFAQIQETEKALNLAEVGKLFENGTLSPEWKTKIGTPEGRKQFHVTDAEAQQWLEMTLDVAQAQTEAIFDAKIARDKLPFPEARKVQVARPQGLFAEMVNPSLDLQFRFQYEADVAQQRLLEAALELQVIKLETGQYPDHFEAPLDPFGDGVPLVYAREGDTYDLYSVGPDGKDDGGAEIQTLEINRATGAKTVTGQLTVSSTGDILAPGFE